MPAAGSGLIAGFCGWWRPRPGGFGGRRFAATILVCERSSVPGVTIRCPRSALGSSRVRAGSTTRGRDRPYANRRCPGTQMPVPRRAGDARVGPKPPHSRPHRQDQPPGRRATRRREQTPYDPVCVSIVCVYALACSRHRRCSRGSGLRIHSSYAFWLRALGVVDRDLREERPAIKTR